MSRLARLEGNEVIKSHKATVMISLKDADISIKRHALDLLFAMRCAVPHSIATRIGFFLLHCNIAILSLSL